MYYKFNEAIRLLTDAKINKIIIRDSDFIRTPAMKIARQENGTLKK